MNPSDVFQAKVIESINILREDFQALRSEVSSLKTTTTTQTKYCSLYVRLADRESIDHIAKSLLESLLKCSVFQYARLVGTRSPSFKVKVAESDVQSAVATGAKSGCFVAPWTNNRNGSSPPSLHPSSLSVMKKPSKSGMKISCWNCRGLSTSLPYLDTLLNPENGSKIMILSEHWLWPYDLHKLDDIMISEDYNALGKSDSRLNDAREGGRGCGGIGILWHKSISASPLPDITSDRICGIRFSLDDGDGSVMTVIGGYLPCLDQGVDCYRDHLVELERVISDAQQIGSVCVLSDFNAHLHVGGVRCASEQNLQGVLLQEVLERCDLSAVSMGALASGPSYTYCSGEARTTVDYILMHGRGLCFYDGRLLHTPP